ncbi:MAG TPA: FKBP-type peptidyl-prolyl cis-trans isomerase [Flavobacteriales bacterium]|nr:FKBP-type peptidyl-prolyl cis-trans isomerase [Flavobacteriales bacterium]HRE98524.1 FKBP-type peptidyl-prolyl cis-trans isomerase [Flavobacteriales bacterium]HRJ35685.1 FKBP-type peptidyl-prolyl cis-trans isomerase [Flavobacteriales bacterium]HRJ37873.1 FKBP-type peptidyl-prolyl cis-trans isomerase [Flavobacteriales bacterium]
MHKFTILFFVTVLMFSCKEKAPDVIEVKYEDIKENMIEMNRGWTEEEEQIIRNYIRRRNWKMTTSGTGIRYMVYKKGDTLSPLAKEGDIVFVNYEIRLLEGDTLCYSSEGEPESFMVAMDHVENGMHEVVTYLRKGDKAKVIMPYNRAYGLIGDMDKIPPQAPLVYDLEVMDIKKAE